MKSRRLWSTSLWIIALAACGGSKFSENFAQEIQRDCAETYACNASNFTQTDTVDKCVTRTGDMLDKAPQASQQLFVDTVDRCGQNNMCPYVTCTMVDPTVGYAGTHSAQITYDCQQKTACRIANNQPPVTDAVNECITQQSGQLNADTTQQAAFDQRFARCMGLAACAWNACQ